MHHPTDRITHDGLCYTSHGELAGTRNSSMIQPRRIDLTTHHTMSERSYHSASFRRHITVNKNVLSASLNKTFPSFLPCSQSVVYKSCVTFRTRTFNKGVVGLYKTHTVSQLSQASIACVRRYSKFIQLFTV